MKSKNPVLMAALMGPVILFTNLAVAEPPREDLTKVYEAGRAAFNKGDLTQAKTAFAKVLKAKPDFDLAVIYMAQIRHVEARWEARPRSQKIAEKTIVAAVDFKAVTLEDALEVVRRELEKSGGGPSAGKIEVLTDLPASALDRPVSLSVRKLPMRHFADAVAFAGNVRIAWHPKGFSVTDFAGSGGVPEAGEVTALEAMRETGRTTVIPSIQLSDASVEEAIHWLQGQVGPSPLLVLRGPVHPGKVTLQLRNSSLADALNSIAMVADMKVTWHSWGAGLASKSALAVITASPADH